MNESAELICHLGGLEEFSAGASLEKPANSAAAIVDEVQIYVHNVIDPEEERKRLEKQKQQIENAIKPIQAKLNNENFISRAKPEVVEQSRARLKELLEQAKAVERHLAELKGK